MIIAPCAGVQPGTQRAALTRKRRLTGVADPWPSISYGGREMFHGFFVEHERGGMAAWRWTAKDDCLAKPRRDSSTVLLITGRKSAQKESRQPDVYLVRYCTCGKGDSGYRSRGTHNRAIFISLEKNQKRSGLVAYASASLSTVYWAKKRVLESMEKGPGPTYRKISHPRATKKSPSRG